MERSRRANASGDQPSHEPQVDPHTDELVPRRTFLVRFGVTVAAVGVTVGCGGSRDAEEAEGTVDVGNIEDVPVGHFARVPGKQLVLARDTDGLYALSTVCTHLGCDMADNGTISEKGLACACHGSRFALSGEVLAGPATKPLPHYKVDLAANGAITIQAGTIVQSTVRTPVVSQRQ